MSQFNIHTAKTYLSKLIKKALRRRYYLIARDNKPITKLIPLTTCHKKQLGLSKGLVQMGDDFNAPLEDVEDYQ